MSTEPLRRIAILGDIHTEDRALAATLAFLRGLSLDAILSVGDIVDGDGDPDRTVALLLAANVTAVRGNHDRWWVDPTGPRLLGMTSQDDLAARQRRWLEALPTTRRFETVKGPLLLCHAIGDDDMTRLRPHHTDGEITNTRAWERLREHHLPLAFMVCGHSHERMVRAIDGITVINAGTLRRDDIPGFLFVDFEAGVAQFYDVVARRMVREAERVLLP